MNTCKNQTVNIDFVIPWVNGNDSVWLAEKKRYANQYIGERVEMSTARYRDWNNLKYWFRAVEKYAPWVNRIFFVTAGHIPSWMNTRHEKLQIIRHIDYIPNEYLPTFNANPIELNFFRIQGLSEQFVYFNDDTFIMRRAEPGDFFKDGIPLDEAVLSVHCPIESKIIHSIASNDAGVINEHFTKSSILKHRFWKWFHPCYGIKHLMLNAILLQFPRLPGFRQYHGATPLLKSICREVWENDQSPAETCTHRFRDKRDVNQWLFREWAIANGKFIPSPMHKKNIMVAFDKEEFNTAISKIKRCFEDNRILTLCINDFDHEGDDFDISQATTIINSLFERKFPEKSRYEKG